MAKIGILCLIIMVGIVPVSWAKEDVAKIREAMNLVVPGAEPDSITPSRLPGMYEVVYGAEVFYVSADGRYLVHGNVVDLKVGKNITEDRRAEGRLKILSQVDESSMIIYSPKKVKHSITVFTDIDCPYCRRMHQEMEAFNQQGIEIRYMLFPRAGVGSKSYKKAVSVWCSKDRNTALTKAKAGQTPVEKNCENPIDGHMALVEQLGITGTPTLILEDGQVISGYVPADRLGPMLEGGR